ncbi:MAG: hypothetical protein AAGC55_10490 [Myxococcota bacterium]
MNPFTVNHVTRPLPGAGTVVAGLMVVMTAALGAAGCDDTIEAGSPGDTDPGSGDSLSAIDFAPESGSLDDLYQAIIYERCSGQPGLCHNGQFEPNLSTPALTYAYMVDRPAIENPTMLRVAPGDPDRSFLIDKLRGRDVGTIMPLGADPLTEAEIQMFEDWIRNGALRRPGAEPAPDLNNPPNPPEIAFFDSDGERLDTGPFTVPVGTQLVLRHSVRDFETADGDIPFALFLLAAPNNENLVLNPGSDDPAIAITRFDPSGPMGITDQLNYRFEFTIPDTAQLIDDDSGEIRTVPASGLTLTPVVLYFDSDNMTAFSISDRPLTVQ